MNLPPSASYNVFAHAFEKGYFFAIRVKDINVKRLLRADSLPQQMDRWADVILTHSNAKKKRLHPELESLYRCICKAVPFDFITDSRPEYRMRLHVVRFQIAEGVYENIITNLPEKEFSCGWSREFLRTSIRKPKRLQMTGHMICCQIMKM